MPSKRTPSMTASYDLRERDDLLRSGAPDPHLLQRLADRGGDVAHLVRVDGPDAADAERLDLRELAGIQDVAAGAHLLVEGLERVAGIRGRMEGHDDRRLHVLREERA